MDTKFAMYGVENITGTLMPTEEEEEHGRAEQLIVDYSFENHRRVLWAYVAGKWRYQLVSDAQLAGLGNTLFASNSVEAYYKGDELIRLRGWKDFS